VLPAPSLTNRADAPWHERTPVIILVLLLAAVIPYLNSFNVPWYFDDTNNIVDNPLIRDLPRAVRGVLESRGLAMLTFALNHRLGGLDPTGYHAVNLVIHAMCVLVVWQLLRQLLRQLLGVESRQWALIGAMLFAVHPLQTQAVTYVVQRMTSLSALFFIAAICCYLGFLDAEGRRRRVMYALAVLYGALAVLTKEHTAVLPLMLLLTERYFRPGRGWRAQLLNVLPFCLAPAGKVVEILLLPVWRGDVAASIRYADQLQSLQNVTPVRYLFTEFSVVWYYFKLLILPVGQMLDYGWPVVGRLLTLQNVAALGGLVCLWTVAGLLRHRRPLFSFGIAWFFVALSVESTIIPLDPIFEHRLYLPLFGFVLVVVDLLKQHSWPKGRIVVAAILPVLAILTWQRNALWNDPVAFFEDNLRRSPGNVRVMVMLGNAYAADKRPDEGLRMIEQAMQLNDKYDFAYTALGKILIDQGRGAEAIAPLQRGLEYQSSSVVLNEYLGIAYGGVGDYPRALTHFRRAMQLKPDDASVYTNIGVVYSWIGDDRQAVDYFEQSLKLAPDSEKTLFNYASTLFNLGDKRGALDALRAVVKVNPDNVDAQYGLGIMAFEFGTLRETAVARDELRRLGDEERAAELGELLNKTTAEKTR